MREVTPETAVDYLRSLGKLPEQKKAQANALGWGVSNIVIRVDVEDAPSFVLKQARERLRTKAHWVSRLERIWTERTALEVLSEILPPGVVPRVLFEVPEDYLFAMTCAPDDSVVWKERLLQGEVDASVAGRAGAVLGKIHSESVGHQALAPGGALADLAVFEELRIEPFYRSLARIYPDLEPRLNSLIHSLLNSQKRCFVHADFSPKNILIHSQGITLVDFETAHAGDPAYDLGFFLSHLLLKAIRAYPFESPFLAVTWAFWQEYHDHGGDPKDTDLLARTIDHAVACVLARIDGTSPVDYLNEAQRDTARRFARGALLGRLTTWDQVIDGLAQEMRLQY